MKINFVGAGIALLLLTGAGHASAEILAGPVRNPANGHDYYLLTPNSWPAAETEAENLGGTLAIVKTAAEQKWVFAHFGHDGDTERSLWIGLHRQWPGGPFIWMDGSKLDYANWCDGQPDNGGGVENSVHMWAAVHQGGCWNDATESASLNAVVEVPGRADEKALTPTEKSLIGIWYETGRPDRQAWIAGTQNQLFLITHDRHAARLIVTGKDVIYDADRQYGQIVKDHIVWSDNSWWSRHPAKYLDKPRPKAGEKTRPETSPANQTD